MISAGDFRNGITIELEGNIYQIIEFQHVKPGKGAAFVRTKLKNIISGGVVEKTFRPTEKCPTAHIDRKDMQYLYADDDFYHFMDVETYDQIDLPKDEVGDALKFVKENETEILFTNCSGKSMSRQGFWKVLKGYAEEAGIQHDITPHTLRHSFAAHMLQNGADVKSVQEMLGHSDISTTQVYLNFGVAKMRDVYMKAHPRH